MYIQYFHESYLYFDLTNPMDTQATYSKEGLSLLHENGRPSDKASVSDENCSFKDEIRCNYIFAGGTDNWF